MSIEHNTITDPDIHQPKGASTASANHTMKADGAGSTSWAHPSNNALIEYGHLYTVLTDLDTLGTIGTTPVTMTFGHAGVFNQSTLNQASGSITVSVAGDYEIQFSASVATTDAADAGDYIFTVLVNGVTTILEAEVELTGTTDSSSVFTSGILSLSASDVVTVQVESDEVANTDDLDILSNSLVVKLVRAT